MTNKNESTSSRNSYLRYVLLDDDDDDHIFNVTLVALLEDGSIFSRQRISKSIDCQYCVRDRLEWESHVKKLMEEGPNAFSRLYRIEYDSFKKLCTMINPIIRDFFQKGRCNRWHAGKRISTEIMLHCLLRWLAGGSYLDIRISAGISVASFYRVVHICIDAVLLCKDLSIDFPQTEEELQAKADAFKAISSHGVFEGCVGCIDGLLMKIITPSCTEAGNVKSFFSGHYHTNGINIQAVCDSNCRFTSVCVAAPGGTNDIAAFRKSPVKDLISNLPIGKYVIGDNAYICNENLLTPFSGKNFEICHNETALYLLSMKYPNPVYNFYSR